MLQKLREDEPQSEKPLVELDSLGRTDWVRCGPRWPGHRRGIAQDLGLRLRALLVFSAQARLWVQLMRELRHGVKLKKVQEQEFNPLPTEFQLTPFEMLMQDIRARNYKLRKVMVSGAGRPRSAPHAREPCLVCWPRTRHLVGTSRGSGPFQGHCVTRAGRRGPRGRRRGCRVVPSVAHVVPAGGQCRAKNLKPVR